MSEEWIIRVLLVATLVVFFFYQFGYSDKFPYIGKNQWSKRKHYPETLEAIWREVSKHTNGAPLSDKSYARISSTADMVLKALSDDYQSVEVNLPKFDCGAEYKDLHFVITRSQIINMDLTGSKFS